MTKLEKRTRCDGGAKAHSDDRKEKNYNDPSPSV